jgi:drug/metabolite transporter (DMT)-like permease
MVVATLLNAIFGFATASLPQPSALLLLGILAAGLFEGFYFYLLNTAYAHQTLGVAYTIMRGGAMVLVWIISSIALHETATAAHVASVSAILVGIVMVQRTFNLRDLFNSGAYAAYLCAGCIAGYHLSYGIAVRTGAAPAFVFAAAMACGVVTYLACGRRSAMQDVATAFQRERSLIAFGGVACGLSFLLFLTALTLVEPGQAISLRNTSVVFGVLLSLIAGERFLPIQWTGVLCVVGGVLGLIAAG